MVTCADLRAKWQVFINPKFNVVSREGWQDVRSISCKRGVRHGRLQDALRRLAVRGDRQPVPGPHHPGPGHEPDVQQLDPGLERTVEVPELAERRPAHRREERALRRRPEDEARPRHLPVHPRHEHAVPGDEGGRGTGHAVPTAAPDRRFPDRQEVRRRQEARVRIRAPRHPVRCEGPSGAQAAVRSPGAGDGHQPRPDRFSDLPTIAPETKLFRA